MSAAEAEMRDRNNIATQPESAAGIQERVAIAEGHHGYGEAPPYHPAVRHPEYPFRELAPGGNPAYEGVREALELLGLDAARFGTKKWNPLGELIKPGQTVVVKPNFVRHFRETQEGDGQCLITHGSIIRAAVDYAHLALGGRGRLIIADAPQNDADFEQIRRMAGLEEIQDFYRRAAGFDIEIYDLRPEAARKVDGVIVGHRRLPGDPAGYVTVDLGRQSAFAEIEHLCHLLYGSEYDKEELRRHHRDGRHEYLISGTILNADCVINLPKLKTHKKTGFTACMKNLVGINGNKNWLPHHREGTPAEGGDEFPEGGGRRRLERGVVAAFKRVFPLLGPLRVLLAGPAKAIGKRLFGDTGNGTIRSGNWYGNDTTWRMVHDLNRIATYADADGRLLDRPIRRIFSIVDAIVAGEGNGPLDCTPKATGCILAGTSTVAVDAVCARLMGFDHNRLQILKRAFGQHLVPLPDVKADLIRVCSVNPRYEGPIEELASSCAFRPHFGWDGQNSVTGRQPSGQ